MWRDHGGGHGRRAARVGVGADHARRGRRGAAAAARVRGLREGRRRVEADRAARVARAGRAGRGRQLQEGGAAEAGRAEAGRCGEITAAVTDDGQLAWVSAPITRVEGDEAPLPLRAFAVYEKDGAEWKLIALHESLALAEPGAGASFKKVVPPKPAEPKPVEVARSRRRSRTTGSSRGCRRRSRASRATRRRCRCARSRSTRRTAPSGS